MAYQTKYLSQGAEAVARMPFTAMSREEVRLVSCPECGADSATWCLFPLRSDPSVFRKRTRIHKRRIEKAREYRSERRI